MEFEEKDEEGEGEKKGLNESSMTLNLEFDWEDKKGDAESLHTLNLSEGFEMQDAVGGHHGADLKTPGSAGKIGKVRKSASLAESSGSEVDSLVMGEKSPLVVRA